MDAATTSTYFNKIVPAQGSPEVKTNLVAHWFKYNAKGLCQNCGYSWPACLHLTLTRPIILAIKLNFLNKNLGYITLEERN